MSYKGHQFEKWMTPEEWALFETNYKNESPSYRKPFKEYLEGFNRKGNHFSSFYEFIASAFDWYTTEENDDFWEDIADREEPLNEKENGV